MLLSVFLLLACDVASPPSAPPSGQQAHLDLTSESLRLPTAYTVGIMNVYSNEHGWLYRVDDHCAVRRLGSVNEAEPLQKVLCPEAMQSEPWSACQDGMITRAPDASCTCHTLHPADARPARVNSTAPIPCPLPALVPDEITLPLETAALRNPRSAYYGLVYRDTDGTCIVDAPDPPGLLRPSGSHLNGRAIPCPDGMFTGCTRGIFTRLPNGQCTCDSVEGDPPRSGLPGPCPDAL